MSKGHCNAIGLQVFMLIFRYLSREVLSAMLAVTFVVLLIIISGRFVRFLADAAAGQIAADAIFWVMYYRLPNFIELILPLGFFIGIMLSYGRLYVESEMVVMATSGVSRNRLLAYTMVLALGVSGFMAFTSLYLSPTGEMAAQRVLNDPKTSTGLGTLLPGTFQNMRGSDRIFYTERLYDDRTRMKHIFVSDVTQSDKGLAPEATVIVAESGRIVTKGDSAQRYLELYSGYQYQGRPGHADYRIARFDKYGIRLPEPRSELARIEKMNAVPSRDLIGSDNPAYQAALQWRLSLPVIIFVVAVLALGMSRSDPRKGRYTKMFPAILLYLGYLLSLNAGRSAIEAGTLSPVIGLWPIHVGFLVLGLCFYYYDIWLLKWQGSRSKGGVA